MVNDFSVEHFQEELREELEDNVLNSKRIPEKKDPSDERFKSILDFMELVLHKSFGMFDKMMEVLQNFNSSQDWKTRENPIYNLVK